MASEVKVGQVWEDIDLGEQVQVTRVMLNLVWVIELNSGLTKFVQKKKFMGHGYWPEFKFIKDTTNTDPHG